MKITGILSSPSTVETIMPPAALSTVFLPFETACKSKNPALSTIAIDCLGKLFSYNFWTEHNVGATASTNGAGEDEDEEKSSSSSKSHRKSKPSSTSNRRDSEDGRSSMESESAGLDVINSVIDMICSCFDGGENTDEKVQLQIIKVRKHNFYITYFSIYIA